MQLPPFDYRHPGSLDEALGLLDDQSLPVAGGSDLLVNMKLGLVQPRRLVSLARLPGFSDWHFEPGKGLCIGAGCRLTDLADARHIIENYPALAAAIRAVGSQHVRNVGTLGGNLCLPTRCWFTNQSEQWRTSRSPCFKTDGELCHVIKSSARCHALNSSDTAPALIALGASIELRRRGGERALPLADFYADDGVDFMQLEPGEVLTEIRVPPPAGQAVYIKVAQRQGLDYAAATIAAWSHAGRVRLVVGSVGSCPMQLSRAAAIVESQGFTDDAIDAAAKAARVDLGEVSNLFTPPAYKRRLVRGLVKKALRQLASAGSPP